MKKLKRLRKNANIILFYIYSLNEIFQFFILIRVFFISNNKKQNSSFYINYSKYTFLLYNIYTIQWWPLFLLNDLPYLNSIFKVLVILFLKVLIIIVALLLEHRTSQEVNNSINQQNEDVDELYPIPTWTITISFIFIYTLLDPLIWECNSRYLIFLWSYRNKKSYKTWFFESSYFSQDRCIRRIRE